MPDEAAWETFYEPSSAVVALLGPRPLRGDVIEFGCGYGTFTVAAATHTLGTLTALDIEAEMVAATRQRLARAGVTNVHVVLRDAVVEGPGVPSQSQVHAMIYNLLHIEEPTTLLHDARSVLCPGGHLSVMHWRSDIETPRGPTLDIRPTPQQCASWMAEVGFTHIVPVDLGAGNPYHFGLVATAP